MKLGGAVLAAVAAMSVCVGARAAPPALEVAPEAGASAGAPDPQRLALAQRYMVDVHSERLLRATLDETLRRALETEFRRMNAGIPVMPQSAQAETYQAAVASAHALEPRVHDRVARLLASEYTTQELQALVDFYETPVGRSIAEKSLDIPAAARRVTQDMGPQFLAEFKRRLCAHEPLCASAGAGQ
jgi:hypothetical protein